MADATMSLYQYAKQVISKEVPMAEDKLDNKIEELYDVVMGNKYTMLLSHERRDFTVFCKISLTKEDIKETLVNRGKVLLIDKQQDGAYEIWIRDNDTDENFVYYLFDYSNGIVGD